MSGYERNGYKRRRSNSPPRRPDDQPDYRDRDQNGPRWSHKEQMRLNQIQEDERMREWVSQEDEFVVKQAKKKAEIRIKEGRAKPIDWLAVTMRAIDPTRNPLDDEIEEADLEVVDPNSVFEDLSGGQLTELGKDITAVQQRHAAGAPGPKAH